MKLIKSDEFEYLIIIWYESMKLWKYLIELILLLSYFIDGDGWNKNISEHLNVLPVLWIFFKIIKVC